MAATGADSVGLRPRGRRWMRRLRRLLRCPCLRGDGQDSQERHCRRGSLEVPGPPCVRDGGPSPACTETIHITVEDIDTLGLDNPGFSLSEEEVFPAHSNSISIGHGVARSVSACQRAMKKRRLKALSSLPLLIPLVDATTEASGGGGEDRRLEDEGEEEESLWYLHGDTEITLNAGGLLPPPIITLIPPTPSDVVEVDDDDQFFDDYSEGESATHTSGGHDRESDDEEGAVDGTEEAGSEIETEEEDEEEEEEKMGFPLAESQVDGDDEGEAVAGQDREGPEETEPPSQETGEQVSGTPFLPSAYQVARLPEYPRKKSLNKGINLLAFTEHNLDDLSNKDMSCPQLLRAQLNLLPYTTKMETSTPIRNPARRSCSFGDGRRSPSFPMIGQTTAQNQEEEGSSRQRRITIASYMPQSSKDQNGNFAEKDNNGHGAKALPGLNTDEVCQWFSSLGLQRCLPFIREGHLCGADIASVDASTLEMLHLSTPEDRELLLSNIYRELHPPNSLTRRLDSLIETFGPHNNVESFTAALVSMSKSMSAPHVSGLTATPSSLMLRAKSSMGQRSTQLIEITVHALEQIVHLRTPKETTVGKVQESCVKMLGLTEDTHTFTLKDNTGLSNGLSANQQIGNLLTTSKRQLELHLCKKDKQTEGETSKVNGSQYNVNQNVQPAKEEKIKELNQQVDSLQHVILQVQELHHGLVAFCSELKSVDVEVDVTELSPVELRHRLESAQSQLQEKRQSLQNLKENISNAAAQRNMEWRSEIRLIDKMKLNCQVFKAEISVVHLNRQVAHLKNALQDRCDKERPPAEPSPAVGPLSQLLSPQCPALLLVVQACPGPDSRYGFSCCSRGAGQGLVVTQSDHSQLCLEDRLVEVNGVAVVNSTEEDLHGLLLQGGSSAQIVVLRRPSLRPASCQPPGPVHQPAHHVPPPAGSPEGGAVVKETPPQRKLIAI
ncbi:uncharacterized protein LOC132473175 [Gadus macrocephalus]|uniref:uncharacterized protein LOC132473175 n=1 Tax=Gadus macrocephalus TaxID=80720 RepID=UPI0028CB7010|nr:uncharacterized protein LOC132473175 [Gadus macrocephalus]